MQGWRVVTGLAWLIWWRGEVWYDLLFSARQAENHSVFMQGKEWFQAWLNLLKSYLFHQHHFLCRTGQAMEFTWGKAGETTRLCRVVLMNLQHPLSAAHLYFSELSISSVVVIIYNTILGQPKCGKSYSQSLVDYRNTKRASMHLKGNSWAGASHMKLLM